VFSETSPRHLLIRQFWPHIDQSPHRVGFFVAQGLVNLNDNGPDDGGLLVMRGSSNLMTQFFEETGRPPMPPSRIDWHRECLSSRSRLYSFFLHSLQQRGQAVVPRPWVRVDQNLRRPWRPHSLELRVSRTPILLGMALRSPSPNLARCIKTPHPRRTSTESSLVRK
jgi:hypothetical protein